MYLLDTNVVSELRKPRPHGAVVAWLQSVADADLYLSAVTLGEIQSGIELTREQDAAKAAEIDASGGVGAKGLNSLTPNSEKSRTLRVTTVMEWTVAVAAIMASSTRVSDLRCASRAHTRNVCASIGKTL